MQRGMLTGYLYAVQNNIYRPKASGMICFLTCAPFLPASLGEPENRGVSSLSGPTGRVSSSL